MRFSSISAAAATLRILALILVLLPVMAATDARAGLFNPFVGRLDNGMRVVVIEDHRAPVVTHMVWYGIGAADETPGEAGLAHYLEHLMFKGTKRFPEGAFSRIVAENGGQENAFTTHDYTAYFQNIAADKLPLVMEMEADRMTNLVLTEKGAETEKQVVIEERRLRTDSQPYGQFREQVQAAQYLAYPYRIPVIGWQHEIEALNKDKAIAFYRKYYAPNNATLIVAGDVKPEQVMVLARKYYGVIPARPLSARTRPQEPPQRAARRVEFADPRLSVPAWQRGYLAPSALYGQTRFALPLVVLAEVLGGGTTSRLYRELVVRQGIAAYAGAAYDENRKGPSVFHFYARPRGKAGISDVEDAMDAVIRDVLENGVTEAEVKRARDSLAANAVYARDSLAAAARSFGEGLAIGLSVADIDNWPARIRAVTAAEVNEAVRAILRPERSVTGIARPAPKS